MKTIEQLAIPKEVSSDFPFGAIINETDIADGTPIVREVYNDHLVNHYKLLELAGITPTGDEDNETNGYQIVDALKKLPNLLNDIEQIATLAGSVWSIPMNIDLLPNKYVVVARASDNYVSGASYTFKGTTGTTYVFTSTGFNASDEILIIIDQSGVRAYSLSGITSGAASVEIFPVMSTPVSFNDTNKIWYEEDGKLISDVPSIDYLESIIRVELSDGNILVNNIFVLNGSVLCFCVIPGTSAYFFRQFDLLDLSVSTAVVVSGIAFGVTDRLPYVYCEQGFVYVTNGFNNSANDYSLSKLVYNSGAGTLNFISTVDMDVSFDKTTNTAIKGGFLYTMVSGDLSKYTLSTGTKSSIGVFPFVTGQIFGFNGFIYYSSGEVAKKWF